MEQTERKKTTSTRMLVSLQEDTILWQVETGGGTRSADRSIDRSFPCALILPLGIRAAAVLLWTRSAAFSAHRFAPLGSLCLVSHGSKLFGAFPPARSVWDGGTAGFSENSDPSGIRCHSRERSRNWQPDVCKDNTLLFRSQTFEPLDRSFGGEGFEPALRSRVCMKFY